MLPGNSDLQTWYIKVSNFPLYMELMDSHPAIVKASWLLTSWSDFLVIFFLDFRD